MTREECCYELVPMPPFYYKVGNLGKSTDSLWLHFPHRKSGLILKWLELRPSLVQCLINLSGQDWQGAGDGVTNIPPVKGPGGRPGMAECCMYLSDHQLENVAPPESHRFLGSAHHHQI